MNLSVNNIMARIVLRNTLHRLADLAEAGVVGAVLNGRCVYNDYDGHKCAIGALLTDRQMEEVLANRMNTSWGADQLHRAGVFNPKEFGLTRIGALNLQKMHDLFFVRDARGPSRPTVTDVERKEFAVLLRTLADTGRCAFVSGPTNGEYGRVFSIDALQEDDQEGLIEG